MAPRAYWKGYLRLSLVSCPIAMFPATSEREKIRFHQIHKQTGHRIRYQKVDDETRKPVEPDDIVKGYEVRNEKDYFDDIPSVKVTGEMMDLARHIVKTKMGHFHPERFEDRYEEALHELIKKKQHGEKIEPVEAPRAPNVINLMDALRR